jgi:hypothetical protein
LKRIPVEVGISDGNATEISSDGLREGEEVVIASRTDAPRTNNRMRGPRFF